MLNLSCSNKTYRMCEYSLINWEEDIKEVAVDICDSDEDSSGHRVVFYSDCGNDDMVVAYVIGASLLQDRLYKLNKAGFNAPMTEEAIKIIDDKQFIDITH